MKNDKDMVRVVNKEVRLIELPATKNFPGARLGPGGNNLPAEYLRELIERDDRMGERVRAMLETTLLVDETPNATARPEGPEAPASLGTFKPAAAMKLVDAEMDVQILTRWAKNERRKSIKNALATRIASLGGSSARFARKTDDETDTDDESSEG